MATAAAPLLHTEVFSASSTRDALGRVLTAISPDSSEVAYAYDEGGNLQRVKLEHRGSAAAETVVGDITYNAHGRRERVVYGPVDAPTTTTTYAYDPQTYRLSRLSTIRGSDQAALQGLHYHYDPAGNITDIRDTAQQTVYFQNAVVEAANTYEYDALYRLLEATGREHATQGTTQRTHEQLPVGPQPMTSDPSAMRRYTQRYTYDGVGNILKVQHIPSSGTGWTRHYQYAEDGNRLLATSAPGDDPNGPYSHTYSYDAHGSMTSMPHLAAMDWNHSDQLQHAIAGTQEVYFQYAGGIRSRKYTEKSGSTTEERIYLGPFEIYRKRVNDVVDLERESLHVSDGSGRICPVETKTVDEGAPVDSPSAVWGYQLGNHLGSATTEVTQDGAIISYEEYHPFGTTSYAANDSDIEGGAKRYRYIGKERDEEAGLYHCGARYYACWLGRWTAADPIGISGGLSLYEYAASNPMKLVDPSGHGPRLVTEQYTIPYEEPQVKVEGPVEAVYEFEDEPVEGKRPDLLAQPGSPQEDFPGLPPEMLTDLEPGETRVQESGGRLYQVTNTGSTTNVGSAKLLPTDLEQLEARTGSEGAAKIQQDTYAESNEFMRAQLEAGVPPNIASARFAERGRQLLKATVGAALSLLQGTAVVGGVSGLSTQRPSAPPASKAPRTPEAPPPAPTSPPPSAPGTQTAGGPREVTFEEVMNILFGFATRGRPRGR